MAGSFEKRETGAPGTVLINFVFIAASVICIFPLLMILSVSFSSDRSLSLFGYSLVPREVSFTAYRYILKNPRTILNAYKVTLVVTAVGTSISLIITGAMAYVLSRRDYGLHGVLNFILLFTLLFHGGLVPSYITITRVYHLKDTWAVLIVPLLLNPWYVFLMRGFMHDLASDLIDAAKIDGASETRIFFQIVMPVTKPAFATIGVFVAFMYWNDYGQSLYYIDNLDLTSLQFYLYRIMMSVQTMLRMIQEVGGEAASMSIMDLPTESARMALCVLAAGPMLFVFPFFQKYFVRGLTIGSIKG
jgi:putative aldouronate transport system permease protein